MNFKTIDSGRISIVALGRDECGVDLENDIVEGCAEICAVDGRVS